VFKESIIRTIQFRNKSILLDDYSLNNVYGVIRKIGVKEKNLISLMDNRIQVCLIRGYFVSIVHVYKYCLISRHV